MPRPAEELPTKKTCWERQTTQERILVPVTILSIIIIIILIFLIAYKQANAADDNTCNSTVCLTESSKISEFIKTEVNPCDDFYEFACGSFLENAHGDESLALPNLIGDEAKRELFEAYIEPINESEHEMVTFAKKLFRACMNETGIENDNLNSIKEVIRDLGGWPVVEGPTWNDKNFEWTSTTFKLREYGYPFSIFLGLTIDVHPRNFSRYIFKIETPQLWDYSTRHFDKIQLMTELAERFGARDKKRMLLEMTKAHDFLIRLQMEIHNTYTLGSPSVYTISDYQNQCRSINWLGFIQNVIGSSVKVSRDDEVMFPPPQTLNSWFDLISKTPKRTLSNYIIWKVIETTLPYLTEDLRNYGTLPRAKETRDEFCLREVQERLTPSPMDIMCDRKYLSKDRKQKVEELVEDIKTEFVARVESIDWMDDKEKKKALNIAKTVKIIIGEQEDYFDDQILDDLNVDMVQTKSETFLHLLTTANRNHQTLLFNRTNTPPVEFLYDKWYMKTSSGLPIYSGEDNILYVPATSINFLYNENRPNYLNYGALGTIIGYQLSATISKYIPGSEYNPYNEKLTSKTKKGGQEKMECIERLSKAYNENLGGYKSALVVQQSIGAEISHRAYEKWVKDHGEEQELIGNDHTANQLYWISQGLLYCAPSNSYGKKEKMSLAGIVSTSTSNNPSFAMDFKCSQGSKMNPSKKCLLI